MAKSVAFDVDARQGLKRGIDIVAESVRITLGPKGRNVVLEKKFGAPTVTNDGVTIVREIELKDPGITVEDGQGVGTELETVEGMQFDRGYTSPYFVTNPDRMEAALEDPFILVTDRKISAVQDLLPVLEKVVQQGKPLLIVAEDVEGEAQATLIVNKLRDTFQAVAVKAPGFGDRRKAMLEDMAILTGGQVISEELGLKLDSVQLNQLGKARRVTITKDDTTIVEGAGKADTIKGRINQIKAEIEKTT